MEPVVWARGIALITKKQQEIMEQANEACRKLSVAADTLRQEWKECNTEYADLGHTYADTPAPQSRKLHSAIERERRAKQQRRYPLPTKYALRILQEGRK